MTPDFGTWLTISLYLGECYKFKDQGFWASKSPRESISDAQIILYLLDIYRKWLELLLLKSRSKQTMDWFPPLHFDIIPIKKSKPTYLDTFFFLVS
ncbi:hypothetical protein IGI04_026180 [Brassica rapa subsp. trilocularis]|uniref:Uncharacterized protein n=1 Tax=Brassica rapa subsp. trilocularis TaxID=1813537 RepID=A0ABQ7KV89_BRACM|nr:hypothetical protein IGI04_026180 [Brassica rapa subsp. trilocularis]